MNKVLLTITFFLVFIAKISAQCTPVPVPFLQSFSTGAIPNCWVSQNPTTTSTSANVKWKFSGSAVYGASGNGGRPAGTFAFVSASFPYDNEHTVELISPQINLTGLATPYVKFEWFKNHLTSLTGGTLPPYDNNQLKVEINSGAGWVQIWAGSSNSPQWRTVGISLPAAYAGTTVQLKFTVDKDVFGNGYFYDDILLDEVQIIETPTCFEPAAMPVTSITPTSGTINWTAPMAPAPAPAGGYEYYYSPTNTPPVSSTVGTITPGLTANISPLISGTTYYWWVRSVCSAADKSIWVAGTPFTPGQIGGGPINNAFLPIYSCSGFNYSQQIYTASELTTAVGTNTYITSIKLYVSTTAATQSVYNEWVVYMGNTSQNDFATTSSWVPFSSLTQVYSGNLPTMTAGTWVTIPLSTPFLWDGTSNVVIAVDENSPGTACTANWGSYFAGTNKGMIYYNTTTNPNPAVLPASTTRLGMIPIIRMDATTLAPCTNTPPTNIVVNNISSSSANVSWTPTSGATYVLRYRSLPGGTWTTVNLTIPLTNTYTIGSGLLESTQYEVEIATVCNTSPAGAFSTPVTFTTPGVTWCPNAAQFNSATYGYISNVTVNPVGSTPLNNTSAQSQYTNFSTNTALDLTLVRGTQNNQISVGKTWSGAPNSNYTNVWIDFNRDGIFDTSDLIYTSGSNAGSPVSGTFSVPSTTYAGPNSTKMRVQVSIDATAGACSGNTYGEVEDYAVRFIDPISCTSSAPANLAATNLTPVSAILSWMPAQGATYVVQWRALTNPASVWIPISPNLTVSSYLLTGLNEQIQYEFRVVYICNGVQGNFSSPLQFTTPAVTWCNHVAQNNSGMYGWISNVTVNPVGSPTNFNNTSLQSQYTDYSTNPALQITLARGTQNNSISVGKTWSGTPTQFANYTNIWIDYDRNGIFAANELIYTSGSNASSNVTGMFNVPAITYNGPNTTKMRVVVSSTAAIACSGSIFGEVEDYAVKFVDLQPCSTTAPVPTVSNMTSSTAYVSWTPTTNASYRIRWREGATGVWQLQPLGYVELSAGQSFYTITGLLEQTAYQVQVQAQCGTSWGNFGSSTNFTTPSLTYCNMIGNGTNDHISNVKITPINFPIMDNTSIQTNYFNYTTPATLINLEVGSTGNQISVSKEWLSTTFSDAVYAWIDWNRDGNFADSERILTSASSALTPVLATFDVPATGVYTGPYTTTMRVALNRGGAPVNCVNPGNGEVEDYAVKLRPCSNSTPTGLNINAITQNSATVNWVPAPSNNIFLLEYRAVTTPASNWTVVNASVLGGNPPVQLTGLTPATTYEVRVAAVCGNGGAGNYSVVQIFTTKCDPTPPNLTITSVTSNSAVITWNPIVPNATYVLRWRVEGTIPWNTPVVPQPPSNSYLLTGLNSYVTYEVQVANQCIGEITPNAWSNTQVFTTIRVCAVPPPGLTISTLTPTTAEVVWDTFPGASSYILRYRKVGIPSWTNVSVNVNTHTITGLFELTKYEMQVANVCSGASGNFTPLYLFETPTVVYCQMSSANATTEFISKVTTKPIGKPEMINESLGSTYTDYTGNPMKHIELVQGSAGNQLVIDKTLSNGDKAGVAVWIDFDRNGYFDIYERILADGPNSNPKSSTTFNVPADAFVSMTDYKYVVMRVAMQKDGIPVNCLNFPNGEVEDYTVKISKVPVVNSLNQDEILIYPNPVSTILNIKNISAKANYKIYSSSGRLVSSGLIVNNAIDVSSLINGLYIIDIEDIKGSVQKKFIKEK